MTILSDRQPGWDEADSREFIDYGRIFVPDREERWNFYADPDPDPIDQPSPLIDQLRWLAEAGLSGVDVHWLKAGHAVFGGWRASSLQDGV